MYVGGNYNQYQDYGLFYMSGNASASNADSNVGSRIQFYISSLQNEHTSARGMEVVHLLVMMRHLRADLVPSI